MEKNTLILTTLTRDELQALVIDSVKVCLKNHPSTTEPTTGADSPFISKKEAARLTGLCQSSIDNHARRGQLKRFYFGKSVRFARAEVLALAK